MMKKWLFVFTAFLSLVAVSRAIEINSDSAAIVTKTYALKYISSDGPGLEPKIMGQLKQIATLDVSGNGPIKGKVAPVRGSVRYLAESNSVQVETDDIHQQWVAKFLVAVDRQIENVEVSLYLSTPGEIGKHSMLFPPTAALKSKAKGIDAKDSLSHMVVVKSGVNIHIKKKYGQTDLDVSVTPTASSGYVQRLACDLTITDGKSVQSIKTEIMGEALVFHDLMIDGRSQDVTIGTKPLPLQP